MTKPLILCNIRTLQGSLTGVQRYTAEILGRIAEDVDVIAPSKPLHGLSGHAWEQFFLPLKTRGRLLWSPSNSGPLLVENQIVTIHDLASLDHPEWMNKRFAEWYGFFTPRLINKVRCILTPSEFSRQRILRICPSAASKIRVTPLAADPRFRPVDEIPGYDALESLALPSKHFFVAVGSLEPRKNLKRLLQAWEQVYQKVPDQVWLVLAGASGKALVFEDVSFEKLPPRVHLTGYVADELLPALYSRALASVYISLYEGFGLPPLEAMACGTPVLTSNAASLPEVVGDAGIMVDPLNIDAIGDALVHLAESSSVRERLVSQSLKRASLFNWSTTSDLTLAALKAYS